MKPRTIAIMLIGATAIAIMAVMFVRMNARHQTSVDVDRAVYPVVGIDVSAHNGDIDWDKVAAAGVDFVYIKASEGATWRDARFEENYRAATAAGLNVGIYHFFRFDVEGWRQSVNILRAINGRPLQMPIAIDLEEWSNPEAGTAEIVDQLRSLVELLHQAGREVVIYTNKNGYYRFLRGRFDDVGLWICSFSNPPLSRNDGWLLWQHSHNGRVPGIRGEVDINTINTPAIGSFARYLSTAPAISRLSRR